MAITGGEKEEKTGRKILKKLSFFPQKQKTWESLLASCRWVHAASSCHHVMTSDILLAWHIGIMAHKDYDAPSIPFSKGHESCSDKSDSKLLFKISGHCCWRTGQWDNGTQTYVWRFWDPHRIPLYLFLINQKSCLLCSTGFANGFSI